jgi:predicted nucleic acid-binding protein
MASERDAIVFDTEPLMAYFHDEPGSDPVETYIDAIDGGANGFVSRITWIELHISPLASRAGRNDDGPTAEALSNSSVRSAVPAGQRSL